MARTTTRGPWVAAWAFVALAGLLASVFAPGTCRTARLAGARAAPVVLTIGYAGPGEMAAVGLRAIRSLVVGERLVQLGRDGRVEPSLAERWEQSADGLTWRFFLRPALTFHDGSPIEASLLVSDIRRNCAAGPGNGACRDIVSVETDGPGVIVITLRTPSTLLLDMLGGLSIYRDQARRISAGPFREAPNSKGYAYDAFPAYHRGQPSIDRVELKLFPNARNAWTALMRDEIDMLYEVTPDALDFIEQSSNTQVRSFLKTYVYMVMLNVRHPVLAHRDVRRALNAAVNRTEIIARVFRGHGFPATDHIWPRHWAYRHELPRLRYDPTGAIRLLEGQGLPVLAHTRSEIPSRFRFTCMIPENDVRFERLGLLLQRQLMDVGIDMQIEPVPAMSLPKRLKEGSFDAFLIDFAATPGLDWPYQTWHSPEPPATGFVNHGYRSADGALDRIRGARTEEEMRGAVGDLQRIMRDDPPAVFLLWSETARAVSARFQVPLTPDRDIFSSLRQWQRVSPPQLPR